MIAKVSSHSVEESCFQWQVDCPGLEPASHTRILALRIMNISILMMLALFRATRSRIATPILLIVFRKQGHLQRAAAAGIEPARIIIMSSFNE